MLTQKLLPLTDRIKSRHIIPQPSRLLSEPWGRLGAWALCSLTSSNLTHPHAEHRALQAFTLIVASFLTKKSPLSPLPVIPQIFLRSHLKNHSSPEPAVTTSPGPTPSTGVCEMLLPLCSRGGLCVCLPHI